MPIKVEEEVNPGPMLNSGYSSGSSTSSTNAAGRKKKKSVNTDKKYLSIQCTGYLKSWPLTKVGLEPEASHGAEEGDPESCMSCLVAVGKIQPSFQVGFVGFDNRIMAMGLIMSCIARFSFNFGSNFDVAHDKFLSISFDVIHVNKVEFLHILFQTTIEDCLERGDTTAHGVEFTSR